MRTGAQVPLTRERVLVAAVGVADGRGFAALTMRNLAEVLGVEAMSLYYHVGSKQAMLDGVVEVLMAEIGAAIPTGADGWKERVRGRITAAREVVVRHPWAPKVFDPRTSTAPAVLRYFDDLVGEFRGGGFSADLTHHALHALGSRALGFSQELFEEGGSGDAAPEDMAAEFPHLAEMMAAIVHDDPGSTVGFCDDRVEFEFALDLILDGLERLRDR